MILIPTRLVYSPKAFVYTKNAHGKLFDLSNYVTEGKVERKVNQVSSATVTLRNPYKRFTTPSQGVAFHPMDPITIYLERVPGFPVRVFTGYLDKTPYYQLYPGTITLQASCTLKRLLYSYFDPSLPYMLAFFEQFGWMSTGTGTILSTSANNAASAATQQDVNSGKKPFTDLRDGSLGKLLWATLFDIGQWQDSNIWIEELPTGANGIAARMATLMQNMQADEKQASADFTYFLQQIIGAGSQGSGGGNAPVAPGTGGSGTAWRVRASAELASSGNGWTELSTNGNGAAASGHPHTATHSGGWDFATLGKAYPHGTMLKITDVNSHKSGIFPLTDVGDGSSFAPAIGLTPAVQSAISWSGGDVIIEMADGSSLNVASGFGTVVSGPGHVTAFTGKSAGPAITQAGATAAPGSSSSNALVFPLKQGTYVGPSSSWTLDQGVDISTNGGGCGKAAPLLAIAAGTVVGHGISGFGPDTPTLKLDTPIGGNSYVYYGHAGPDGAVPIGTHVTAGQVIGSVGCGSVGISSGPHLEIGWATGVGAPTGRQSAQHMLDTLKSAAAGQPVAGGGTAGAGGSAGGPGNSSSEAFVASLNFPSIEDQLVALALGAEHKGLMHDQSLLPFVQQLSQASLRSFQSLPNGDFFAFYPDYFGEMGHHDPYWIIDDIEILKGGIDLTDDALATHVFAIGDNQYLNALGGGNSNTELMNELFSAGTITIFNAFLGSNVLHNKLTAPPRTKGTKKGSADNGSLADLMNTEEAVQFIKRYGARPLVQKYPQVRSSIFEMLLAYQQFMLSWSNQFKTPFSFTFMPELYPGGKVAFAQHGLQMYIDSVTHSWNYAEGGFTTEAELSAPSIWQQGANNPDLPPHMVQAMIEPVKKKTVSQVAVDSVVGIVDKSVDTLITDIQKIF